MRRPEKFRRAPTARGSTDVFNGWPSSSRAATPLRRGFGVIVTLSLVASLVLAGAVTAAPAGESLHWALDESAGVVAADGSVNGLDGSLINSPVWAAGVIGGALDFTGGNTERVEVPDPTNQLDIGADNELSFSLWVNTTQTPGPGDAPMILRRKSTTTLDGYAIYLSAAGDIQFVVQQGPSLASVAGSPVNDGAWHHVAGVIDAAGTELYVDGASVGTAAGTFTNQISETFVIGAAAEATAQFDFEGLIDEVRVYPSALTFAEVTELYLGQASNPVVNSTGDAPDLVVGDAVCDTGATNSAGAAECTLRAAIEEANASIAPDSITFALPVTEAGHVAGVWTIAPAVALPSLVNPVVLDASTQPGYAGSPIIGLDGTAVLSASAAIDVQTTQSTIRGFSVYSWMDEGIELNAFYFPVDNVTVEANWVGVTPTGAAAGNTGNGILLTEGVTNSDIGGPLAANGNVVAHNVEHGILVRNPGSLDNRIDANDIHTNGIHGVALSDAAASTVIGGAAPNSIHDNVGNGVNVSQSAGANNAAFENSIYANGDVGIDRGVGGPTPPDAGDLDGHLNQPVLTAAEELAGTVAVTYDLDVVAGTYTIEFFNNPGGVDPTMYGEGEAWIASEVINHPGGAVSYNTSFAGSIGDLLTATTTSGTVAAPGDTSEFSQSFNVTAPPPNPIVNSTGDDSDASPGDSVCDTGALNSAGQPECTFRAALETTNATNRDAITFDIPVTEAGHAGGIWTISPGNVALVASAPVTIDGRTQPTYVSSPQIVLDGTSGAFSGLTFNGLANGSELYGLSVGNFSVNGVLIEVPDVRVEEVYIGLLPDGVTPAPNDSGIRVQSGADNSAIQSSVVSGNTGIGIDIRDSATNDVSVDDSRVGTQADGAAPLPNGGAGIAITDARSVDIGVTTGNVISGNLGYGILLTNAQGVDVHKNNLGLDANQTAPLPNGLGGLRVEGGTASANIGANAAGNAIASNNGPGIVVDGAGAQLRISYNGIGTNGLGADFGNNGHGIEVISAAANVYIRNNEISFNLGDGVRVAPTMAGETGLQYNTYVANTGLAIDLGGDGPTPNDIGDIDVGPNGLLNHPEITAISPTFIVDYDLDVPAGNFIVQFYTNPSGADPSGFGEGEIHVGTTIITHPGGLASYASSPLSGVNSGDLITAHLSYNGQNGNMGSELSAPFATSPDLTVNSTGDASDTNIGNGICNTGGTNSEGQTECTLRAAIEEANALLNADTILFTIPTSDPGHAVGVWTITPATPLPSLTGTTTIDGGSQPGIASTPAIELDGTATSSPGLHFAPGASSSVINDLAITNFVDVGIALEADRVSVLDNWIGLDATGAAAPNGQGIRVFGAAADSIIGVVGRGNVISGNTGEGIFIRDESPRTSVDGNIIGGSPDGLAPLPNGASGISILHADNSEIGTTASNVVVANGQHGIELNGSAHSTTIEDNYIGINATETATLGNTLDGIFAGTGVGYLTVGSASNGNIIGGNGQRGLTIEGPNNTIHYNRIGTDSSDTEDFGNLGDGILVRGTAVEPLITENRIRHNNGDGIAVHQPVLIARIYNNLISDSGARGLDYGPDGPTPNDVGDGDTGTNGLLNYPVLTGVNEVSLNTFELQFDVDIPAGDYRVNFYTNPSGADPSGFGEAESFSASYAFTHPGGQASRSTAGISLPSGSQLTAQILATSGATPGISSEFSAVFAVSGAFVVNSTSDADDAVLGDGLCDTGNLNSEGQPECTLHAAIKEANNSAPVDSIAFDIPVSDAGHASGVWTITPTAEIPSATDRTILDATSQPGYVGSPVIVIDGSLQAATVDALQLSTGSDGSVVRGFSVVNFTDDAVWTRADNTRIEANWLGIHPDGTAGGNGDGIVVWDGAQNTTIGGPSPSQRNVISNNGRGIRTIDDTVTTVNIDGNYIGTDPSGTIAAPNGVGIRLEHGTDLSIGSQSANVISGNTVAGIELYWMPMNAVIENNLIGVSPDGVTPVANAGHGVLVQFLVDQVWLADNTIANNGADGISIASNVTGNVSSVRDLIYNNGGEGIDLHDDGQTANDLGDIDLGANGLLNTVEITNITQNPDTSATVDYQIDLPAGDYNIYFYESDAGGPAGSGQAEYYVGNVFITTAGGVESLSLLPQSFTPGRYVTANVVSVANNATSEFSRSMIYLTGAEVNSTGDSADTTPGDGVCSTGGLNSEGAVECTLRAAIAEANASPAIRDVQFNIPVSDLGHSAGSWTISPTSELPSATQLVHLDATSQPGFGGSPIIELDGSLVGANNDGIKLDLGADNSVVRGFSVTNFSDSGIWTRANDTSIVGNWVGLRPDGTVAGNRHGVVVWGGAQNTEVGGTAASDRNVLSGNVNGIRMFNVATSDVWVDGNYIGTDPTGLLARPNTLGIRMVSITNVSIGNRLANVISGNSDAGIVVFDASINTRIDNNLIGPGSDGVTVIPGQTDGILIDGVSARIEILDNTIAYNESNGLVLENNVTAGVSSVRNLFFGNGTTDIDLGHDGLTPNDVGDVDTGPNGLLNTIEITSIVENPDTTASISYQLDVPAGDYNIYLYESDNQGTSGFGEAERYVDNFLISTPGGAQSLTFPPQAITAGSFVTANVVSVTSGGTSEFSNSITFATDVIVNSTGDSADTTPGDGVCSTGGLNSEGAVECTFRAAIDESNATAVRRDMTFAIPASDPGHTAGAWTIRPVVGLPSINSPLIIDASSQPGYAGDPVIALDGSVLVSATEDGVQFAAGSDGSEVRALSIVAFPDDAIWVEANSVTVAGNWIGIRPDGTDAGSTDGIVVWNGASDVQIGGGAINDTNVIANAVGFGIRAISVGTNDVRIDGNLIGTDPLGVSAKPNGVGISLENITSARVGSVKGNIISGNTGNGVQVLYSGTDDVLVEQNYIGTAGNGTDPLGNGGHGLLVDFVRNVVRTETNRLVFNGGAGLAVGSSVSDPGFVSSSYNTVHSNTGLSIDLNVDGPTPNDASDADTGPNDLLNAAVITDLTEGPMSGYNLLYSTDLPNGTYEVLFYESDAPHATGTGEGQFFVRRQGITVNSSPATFGFSNVAFTPGRYISAHVVDTATSATSEFGPAILAPVFNSITDPGDQVNDEDDVINIVMVGVAGGAAPLTWTATGLPDGVNIDLNTGVISGTASFDSAGVRPVTVTASSTDAEDASTNFTWTVNDINRPPTANALPNQTDTEGDTIALTATGNDPDGDTLTWSAIGLPTGLNISGAGTITGTIADGSAGTYAVTVTAQDPSGATASTAFSWNVNSPPTNSISTPGNQTNAEGDVVGLTVVGTAGGAAPLAWAATGLPDGLSIDSATAVISGTTSFTSAGARAVTITATSADAALASVTFTWTVTNTNRPPTVNPIVDQTDTEGDTVNLSATGTDPDGDTLTWSATGLPSGITISAGGNITGTIDSGAAGTYPITVTTQDPTGATATTILTWTIDPAPPSNNSAVNPGDQTNAEDDSVNIAVVGTAGGTGPLTWSATGLPDGLSIDPATGLLSGTTSFTSSGVQTVTVTAASVDAPSASVTFTWTVTNTNRPPTVNPIVDQTDTEGDTVNLSATGTDPDGDTLTWSATGLPSGITISAGGNITGTIDSGAAGTYPITVTTQDPTGATATTTLTWTIDPGATTTTTSTTSTSTTSTTTTTEAPTETTSTTSTTVDPSATTSDEPDALPFVELRAETDYIAARTSGQLIVPILENDTYSGTPTIVVASRPEFGSVEVVDDHLVVTLPPSFAGDMTFTYTLIDRDGEVSTAEVVVFSMNVLSPASDAPSQPEEITSISDVFGRVSSLFLGLLEIELSTLQLTVLALAPLVFILLQRLFRSEVYASVTGVGRSGALPLTIGKHVFHLRHDAKVWYDPKSTKIKNGVRLVKIQSAAGVSAWVEQDLLSDTGY